MKYPYLKFHFIFFYLNLKRNYKLRCLFCKTLIQSLNFYFSLNTIANLCLTLHDSWIFWCCFILFTRGFVIFKLNIQIKITRSQNITNNSSNWLEKTCRIKSGIAKASLFITAYQNRLSNANKLAHYLYNP